MTNTEIEQQLALINAKTFPLEKIEAMIEFNKQYKKSSFYKKTHLSLEKLQQYYSFFKLNTMLDNINSWLDVDNLANRINNVLEGIDSEESLRKQLNYSCWFNGHYHVDQIHYMEDKPCITLFDKVLFLDELASEMKTFSQK